MSKLILVTAGTSALEKAEIRSPLSGFGGRSGRCQWNDIEDLVKKLNALDSSGTSYTQSALDCYDFLLPNITDKLRKNLERFVKGSDTTFERLSAELASLLAMEKDSSIGPITNEDKIIVLHSDTQDGKLCAEANAEIMKEKSWNVEIYPPIVDLKIFKNTKPTQFINGLRNLDQAITQIFSNGQADKKITVASGGYKGILINVTHTSWAQGAIVIYLFEKASSGIILRKPTSTDDGLKALG